MNIDITPYIKELLYEHNSLVIPGFGALVLKYAPSTIDHVQGLLNPPAKSISFDKNLVTNDGKLIDIIQKKHKLGTAEAAEVVNKYVLVIKDQLDRREMVNILGVGRLYKDFENTIQFIPDNTNFNKESFGLPTVNFYPILREKATAVKAASTNKPSAITNSKTTTYKTSANKSFYEQAQEFLSENAWIPAAALLTLLGVIFIFGVLPLFKNSDPPPISETRINQKPTNETIAAVTEPVDERESNEKDEDAADFEADQSASEDEIDTESITVSPYQKECKVAIGVYGVKTNAQKMIEKIYEEGFDAYRENVLRNGRELTKVGIQFAFETEEEFNTKMQGVKRKFPNGIIVKKGE